MEKQKIIIGASGASGMPILTECLKIIRQDNTHESCLIITDSARCTLEQETDLTVDDLKSMADQDRKSTRLNSSHSGESRMPSSA